MGLHRWRDVALALIRSKPLFLASPSQPPRDGHAVQLLMPCRAMLHQGGLPRDILKRR